MNQTRLHDNQTIDEAFLVRQAVEGMQDALYISDLRTGELTYLSPASAAVTGFSPAEMQAFKTEGARARIHPEDRERYLARMRDLAEAASRTGTPQSEQLEYRWLHKDGTYHWISNSRTLLLDEEGQPKALVGTLRDITDQKEAEAERERAEAESQRLQTQMASEHSVLETIMENTPAALAYLDRDFRFVQVNSAYARDARYSREELLGRNHFDLFPNAENQAIFEHVRDTGEPVRFEARPFVDVYQPEKGITYWDWSLIPVKGPEGQVEGLVFSLLNVTEQERTRQALREIEARFRLSLKNFPVIVASLDRELRYVWVYNPHPAFDPEALIGKRDDEISAPENVAEFMRFKQSILDTGEGARREIPIYVPGEGWRYYDVAAEPVRDESSAVVGLTTAALDITARVQAQQQREQLLAEVERRATELDATIDAISDGLVLYGSQGEFRHLNEAGERILGITAEEYAAIPPQERPERLRAGTPDGRALTPAEFPSNRALRGETLTNYHMVIHQPDGTCVDLLISSAPIRDVQGEIIGIVVNFADITPLITLQEQVQAERTRLEIVLETLPVGVYVAGPNGELLLTNRAANDVWGRAPLSESPEEYGEDYKAWWPDTGRQVQAHEYGMARAVAHGEHVQAEEMEIETRDGQHKYILNYARPVRDESGAIIGGVSATVDITDRRQAEQALRESEARYRSLYDATTAGIVLQDAEGYIVEANEAAQEIIGLTLDQMRGLTSMDPRWRAVREDGSPFPGEEHPIVVARQSGQTVRDVTIGMIQPSGETHWVLVSAAPVTDPDTNVIRGAVATFIDITDRKQAEQALQRYRLLSENARDIILFINTDGRVIEANLAAEQAYGYSRDELLTKTIYDLRAEPAGPLVGAQMAQADAGGITFEAAHRRSDGSTLPVEVSSRGVTVGSQHILLSIIRDITERKQAEQEVRESEARLREVFENSRDMIYRRNLLIGRYDYVSPSSVTVTGFAPDELTAITFDEMLERMHPEDVGTFLEHNRALEESQETPPTDTVEYRWKNRAGTYCWYSASRRLLRDAEGRPVAHVGTIRDITDSRKAEQALRESEERFATAFRTNPNALVISRVEDGTILDVNDAFLDLFQWTRDEAIGKTSRSLNMFAHPEERDQMIGLLRQTGHLRDYEIHIRRKSGEERIAHLSSEMLQVAEGPSLLTILQDVTERRQAEEALRESEERLRVAVQAADLGTWDLDLVNDIAVRSFRHDQIWGYSEPQSEWGLDIAMQHVLPEDRQLIMDAYERGIETGVLSHENRVIWPDGSIHWIAANGHFQYDSEGRPVRVIGVVADITEQREAERIVRESEERFRQVFKNTYDGIYRLNLRTGTYDYANPALERITGFTPEELSAMGAEGATERLHPEDRPRMAEYLNGIFDQQLDEGAIERVNRVEYRFRRKDGEWRWFSERRGLVTNPDGSQAVIGSLIDITERRRAEEALRESEERYRTLFETMTEGFALHEMLYDEQGAPSDYRFLEVNPAFEQQTGLRAADLVGHTVKEVIPGIERLWVERYGQVVRTGEPVQFESWSGPLGRWYNVSAFRTGPERFAVIFLDITDRKRAEEALRDLNETLEERVIDRTARLRGLALELTRAEERERRRLAQVLHDHLQQLLAAARISVNMVRNRLEDDRQVETLGQVDGLLEESIAESRSLTAELSPPVLYDAGLPPALDWLARWMEEKYHLHVEVQAEELDGEVPEEIRLVLFQGARELLFNVVKHAKVDQARVELHRLPDNQIELVVSDQGVGVDRTQIGKQQTKGGFGLFNIRERLESLGGQMQIDSTPGQGTRVTLRVPLRPTEVMEEAVTWATAITREAAVVAEELVTEREKAEQAIAAGVRVVRVLLADDHVIMRQGLARLLEDEPGIELVGQADDGREVVELAHVTRPDIILMDVSMPVMDGIEATRQIKADLPNVRVIGLSMYEGAEVAERMREAGAVDYVPKGGNPAELVEAVRRAAVQ